MAHKHSESAIFDVDKSAVSIYCGFDFKYKSNQRREWSYELRAILLVECEQVSQPRIHHRMLPFERAKEGHDLERAE